MITPDAEECEGALERLLLALSYSGNCSGRGRCQSFLIKGGWGMAVPELWQKVRFQGPCSEGLKPGCHVARQGTHLGGRPAYSLLTLGSGE